MTYKMGLDAVTAANWEVTEEQNMFTTVIQYIVGIMQAQHKHNGLAVRIPAF